MLAWLSTRDTDRPQRWAYVPAAAFGIFGSALLILQPGETVMDVLSWLWPPALVLLVGWAVVKVRRHLGGRTPWLLYPVLGVLVLIAVGGAYETVSAARDSASIAMTGQLVDVGGHRLHIDCAGSGSPTVVLESGAGESWSYWARIVPAIAKTTKVCTYDRAGRGYSDAPAAPQDGLAVAHDLHALLTASGNPGPYVLAGHSTGGAYVRIFATQYPDEVAGLVLLDSQPSDAFTALPGYAGFYGTTHTLFGLLPSLARLGLFRLADASAFATLPSPAREQERADQVSPRLLASERDEFVTIPATLHEAAEFTTFGGHPLAVVTAKAEAPEGWLAAQDRLASLSSNTLNRVLTNTNHDGVITSDADAAASGQAIVDVVSAVRTGSTLPGS